MINSDRGERVFSSLRLESERVSYDAALSSNRAIERSVKRPKQACDFWRGFEAEGFPIVDRLCDEDTAFPSGALGRESPSGPEQG